MFSFNYRKADSGSQFVPLLYAHLINNGMIPFLDTMNMKPGQKLFEHINNAINSCKVGVAVLTDRYFDSYFCLHELALLNESKKRVVPIFYDVKPSQLQVKNNARYPPQVLQRFSEALEETKYTVGLTFDSLNGDWTELQRKISDAVIMNLFEVEEEEERRRRTACNIQP
ncbi:unnamed protein product [Sphenostylis stenocarpa]|uniref:TIR domain-containing protein n=1 Tax=Sphenostylis stenocarpa TaxID=92480 RepID=A0AA86SR11_9FABA|nr:unnamed protein product [Sphenostylis stenocarpa]